MEEEPTENTFIVRIAILTVEFVVPDPYVCSSSSVTQLEKEIGSSANTQRMMHLDCAVC